MQEKAKNDLKVYRVVKCTVYSQVTSHMLSQS